MTRRILKSPLLSLKKETPFLLAFSGGEQGGHSVCKISQAAEAKRRTE